MKKKYMFWLEELNIKKISTNSGTQFILEKKDFKTNTFINLGVLNETAVTIISSIDGETSFETLLSTLSQKYDESIHSIELKVNKFLKMLLDSYDIHISYEDTYKSNKKVPISNVTALYPTVASIELTDKCNLKCLHCYGDFECKKSNMITLEQFEKLLIDLNNIGVQSIELTGGEATTHPHLKEILLLCVRFNFPKVALLTNGLALNKELMDLIITHRNIFTVQIDLHSLNDNYLEWFTKAKNTLYIIQNNIEYLAAHGVTMRIATIVTKKNLHELEQIADYVHTHKIKSLGVSPVVELGRAKDSVQDLLLDNSTVMKDFDEILVKINDKYENLLFLIDNPNSHRINCGCVTSHVVISSTGDIKICSMCDPSFVIHVFGNVFTKPIKQIYDENSDYVYKLYHTKLPELDDDLCVGCNRKAFCAKCFARALSSAKELKEQCTWYQNLPQSLKDHLILS